MCVNKNFNDLKHRFGFLRLYIPLVAPHLAHIDMIEEMFWTIVTINPRVRKQVGSELWKNYVEE